MRLAAAAMAPLDPLTDGERGVFICTASVAAFDGQIGQAAAESSAAGARLQKSGGWGKEQCRSATGEAGPTVRRADKREIALISTARHMSVP